MRLKNYQRAVGVYKRISDRAYCASCISPMGPLPEMFSNGHQRWTWVFPHDNKRRDRKDRDLRCSCGKDLDPGRPERPARRWPWYVNKYEQVWTYGGPEEGGWYYWRTYCVSSVGYPSKRIAERMVKRCRWAPESGAKNFRWAVNEPQPGKTKPRQHYE